VTPDLTLYGSVITTNFIHKGIVLNIEDFGGRIEVTQSTFTKNMHNIPGINYKY